MSNFDWAIKELSVVNLRLDAKNPRIPLERGSSISQRELIHALFEHDEALEIVKSIVQKGGYFAHEIPIAIKENDKFIVVEGNRRLAALKVLTNPSLVPQVFLRRTKKLLEEVQRKGIVIPKKIKTAIAHNRRNAVPALIEKHTGQNIKSWKRPQQAAFIRALIDYEGMKKSDISKEHGYTEGEIEDYLKSNELYQLAKSVEITDKSREIVENQRKFPITNLERAFNFPAVRSFFGISFAKDGEIIGKSKRDEFEKVFAKFVELVASGKADSRVLNKGDNAVEFLSKHLNKHKPTLTKNITFSSRQIISEQQSIDPKPLSEKKHAPYIARRLSVSVIPRGTRVECENGRIQKVFDELKRTSVSKSPNSSAMLMRVLIELCTSNYIDLSGKTDDLIKRFDKNKNRKKDWYPSVRQQLTYVIENLDNLNIKIKGLQLKALNRFVTRQDEIGILDSLDKFAHNRHIIPTEQELRAIWEEIASLMNQILKDPLENI